MVCKYGMVNTLPSCKPWTLYFVSDHNDLLQVSKISPNYKLTKLLLVTVN